MMNECSESVARLSFKFDGNLVGANGQRVVIDCCVSQPLVGGDVAIIELNVPTALMPIPEIHNPCQVSGKMGATEAWLDDVWYREMPQKQWPSRSAGLSPIVLTHVGKLKITRLNNQANANQPAQVSKLKSVKFHLNQIAFLLDKAWLSKLSQTPNRQSDELYVVNIPMIGTVRFIREWVFINSSNSENAYVKSGVCAVVELDTETDKSIEECLSCFEDALTVISIFTRQRIMVLGWEAQYDDRHEQVWKDPLEAPATKYVPYEPNDYLIDKANFANFSSIAAAKFIELDLNKKEVFRHMSIGLAPFINLNASERFLTMFHALEACRKFAPEVVLKDEDLELIKILEASKPETNKGIAKRIDGFIKIINSKKPSLRHQLDSVLNDWQVDRSDLWPLNTTEKLPGLIDIRDKLSHAGPKAIHHQGLAVATLHLSILFERIILSQLNIPIAEASVSPDRLNRFEEWYRPAYWQEQRKIVIYAK